MKSFFFPLFYNMKFNLSHVEDTKKRYLCIDCIKKFMKPYNLKENVFEKG